MRKKPLTKTVYMHGDTEDRKVGEARIKKILKLTKQQGGTQSQAMRTMIDAYPE